VSGTEAPAPAPRRAPLPCQRCGATIEADQGWCLECGLAARTRLARTPNWRTPLVLAGVVGLGAIVALIVAFLVLTGDNAPLPTTAAAPAPVATTAATTAPPVDTTATTTTVPAVPTTPGTTPVIPGVTQTTTVAPAGTTATTP
jgi:ribosomal protein L37E